MVTELDKDRHTEEVAEAAHKWRAVLSRPGVTDLERHQFEIWLEEDPRHPEAYARASSVWAALGHLKEADIDEKYWRLSWRERFSAMCDHAQSVTGVFDPRLVGAAIVLLVLTFGVSPYLLEENTTQVETFAYATDIGATMTARLSDGTTATLGAASELQIAFTEGRRTVRLIAGDALFEVAKDPDRPFSVIAGDLTAMALGTAFDVRNNGGVVRVAVAEGVVAVSYPFEVDGHSMGIRTKNTLEAGQQIAATSQEGLRSVGPVDISAVGAWRDKRLFYEAAPLSELVADARRYSPKSIEFTEGSGALAAMKVTATFDGGDIDHMLATLPQILPVYVEFVGSGKVVISDPTQEQR